MESHAKQKTEGVRMGVDVAKSHMQLQHQRAMAETKTKEPKPTKE